MPVTTPPTTSVTMVKNRKPEKKKMTFSSNAAWGENNTLIFLILK